MMSFNFLDWYGALNPIARISVTILGITLASLTIVGVYFLLRAIGKGIVKGTKAATHGMANGVKKVRQKFEDKKQSIREKMEQAKGKITTTFGKVEKSLEELFNGKSVIPIQVVAPVVPVTSVAPESSPVPAPTNPESAPTPVETSTMDKDFKFNSEKPPQYCPHCGALFTEKMLRRVGHDRPAFCVRCGLGFVPMDGSSYKKLVDEVLQP